MSVLPVLLPGDTQFPKGAKSPNLGLDLSGAQPAANNALLVDSAIGAGGVVPVVQAALQEINTTTTQGLTITATATTLYTVSIYMKAVGTGSAGHTITANIGYISPDDMVEQNVALILPLDSANVVMETYPLLVSAGTPLTLATVYGGGATNDPYTISVRLVQMPS